MAKHGGKRSGAGRKSGPKRHSIIVRVSNELVQDLEASAKAHGRTRNQEIEDRLNAMSSLAASFGGADELALFQATANLLSMLESTTGRRWLHDATLFDLAIEVTSLFMRQFRPDQRSGDDKLSWNSEIGRRIYEPMSTDERARSFVTSFVATLLHTPAMKLSSSASYAQDELLSNRGIKARLEGMLSRLKLDDTNERQTDLYYGRRGRLTIPATDRIIADLEQQEKKDRKK